MDVGRREIMLTLVSGPLQRDEQLQVFNLSLELISDLEISCIPYVN